MQIHPLDERITTLQNTVWDIWEGHPSRQYVQKQCEGVLDVISSASKSTIITDLRKAKGTFIHSLKYLSGYYRQLNFHGVSGVAYLLSPDQALILRSLELALIENSEIEFQIFYKEDAALNWCNRFKEDDLIKRPFQSENLVVHKDRQVIFVPFGEINFVAADGHSCNVHAQDEVYRINMSLKDIDRKLPKDQFQRIHKSYLVNVSRIKKLASDTPYSFVILLEGLENIKIPIGKKYLQNCKRILGI